MKSLMFNSLTLIFSGEVVKRKRPFMNGEVPSSAANSGKSTDYYFLMSLLPFIEPLDLMDKIDLREAIQKEVGNFYKKHNTKLINKQNERQQQEQEIELKREKN